MKNMNPVVHFEMPAKDKKRVADFYSKVFGWKMTHMGENMGNYLLAQTTETDEKGMVQTKGAINGGFWESKNSEPPHVVISVDDIETSRKAVEEAGGEIVSEKMNIPGVGFYYSFKDSEGNIVGMLQPAQM